MWFGPSRHREFGIARAGGVDPTTCETFGFDGTTGDPAPDRNISEGEIYSAIAQALDIEFNARFDMSGVLA